MKKLWYARAGFDHNPFSIKPAVVNDYIIGQADTIERIQDSIKEGGMSVIVGSFGVGKTTFLKSVIKRFSGRRKVVYYSCNRLHGSLDIDRLLYERFGVVGKLLRYKSKNMILLLDEADHLSDKDIERVQSYYKKG